MEKHIIYVYPSDDWEIEITDFGPFEFFKITDRLLNIAMPWGKETLNCPLKDVIAFQYEGTPRANAVKNGEVVDMKMYAKVKE